MPSTPPTPADRIIARFDRSHRNDWSQQNRDNAVRVLNRAHEFLAAADATLLHDDVDELVEHLEDYLEHRRATPIETGKNRGKLPKGSTLLVEHRQLCAFYRWATADQGDGDRLLRRNPMRRIPAPPVEPPDPDLMPIAETWQYDALLATCRARGRKRHANDRRDAAMLATLWHTGVRRSELSNIDYERIDWEAPSVYLPKTKGGRRAPKARHVPLVDELVDILDLWIDERGRHDGPLFPSQRGGRLQPQSVTLMLQRRGALAAKALGLDAPVYMPAHGYRRSSAIDWLDNGGAESTLMTNHGWSTRKMIDVYTAGRRDKLAAADARRVAEARRSARLRSVS